MKLKFVGRCKQCRKKVCFLLNDLCVDCDKENTQKYRVAVKRWFEKEVY